MLFAVTQFRDSLAYFVANTFALGACWVVSAAIGAAALALAGGQFVESFTGSYNSGRKAERLIAILGSGLLGLNGGLIIAQIDEFAGILSMVYLWAFVTMATAAFFGRPGPRPSVLGLNDDLETALLLREAAERSEAARLSGALSKTGTSYILIGAAVGGLIGLIYGLGSAMLIPLSTDDNIFLESSTGQRLIWAAASLWAILCGFGGSVAVARAGLGRGLTAMIFGLILGTGFGGLIAVFGLFLGNTLSAALNGAIGAAFFGAILSAEIRQQRLG
ncbi:MAG: hypothetical protein AB7K24_16620 [Gemmataceae bacterium]